MASEKSREVYQVLKNKGFPEEFCKEVAYKYMNTDFTANRMLGLIKFMVMVCSKTIFKLIAACQRIIVHKKSPSSSYEVEVGDFMQFKISCLFRPYV